MSHSAWARLLELALPGETDRLLLKMCVLEGEGCVDATKQWLAAVGSPTEYFRGERHGHKRLLPLLATTVGRTALALPEGFADVLRAAELHEALRAKTFFRQARCYLAALQRESIDVVVLPGVALVPRHYGDPAIRHCHDLDLWIAERDRAAGEAAIAAEGASRLPSAGGSSLLKSSTGLQIALHTRLSPLRLFEPPRETLLARRQCATLERYRCDTLSDADLLLYVCLRAAAGVRRRSLQWACDAVRLVNRSPALDWERLIEMARMTGAGLPLSVLLRFLGEELGAAVPASVPPHLAVANELTSEVEEVLCHLVVVDPELDAGRLARSASDMRLRFALLRHLMLPSRAFLNREKGVTGGVALSREYLRRALRATQKLGGLRRQTRASLGNGDTEDEKRA